MSPSFQARFHGGHVAVFAMVMLVAIVLLMVPPPRGADAAAPAGRLASDSETAATTRALLPDTFVTYETPHYVLLSDASSKWARRQTDLLEKTHHQYRRFCRRLGLDPGPIRHKLVAVAFAGRDDYQAFARMHDHVTDPQLSGYYSPGADRIVFYDVESNPSLAAARGRLVELQSQVRDIDRQAQSLLREGRSDAAAELRDVHRRYHRHLKTQRAAVESFSRDTGTATTVHEAVHQLLFHTGVQSRSVQYPLWICEGLATAFETDAPKAAFGPDQEYDERRRRYDELHTGGGVLPLRRLVTVTELNPGDDVVTDAIYNQSYALVTWMSRFRREELRAYLAAMQELRNARPSASRHLDLFQQAFGDITTLERAWLAHERSRRR